MKQNVLQTFLSKGIGYDKKPTVMAVIKVFQENLANILGCRQALAASVKPGCGLAACLCPQ
jgi:hypothetical protein